MQKSAARPTPGFELTQFQLEKAKTYDKTNHLSHRHLNHKSPAHGVVKQPHHGGTAFVAGQNPPGQESLLVLQVREATRQFIDVNNAEKAGYAPVFGCVTGPDHGAMGIHYVNGTLVGDGQIDVFHPEALIYEPEGNARRLVGVEYIVDAATWLAAHDNNPPDFGRPGLPTRPQPQPFQPAYVFRVACLGLEEQPQWRIRGLEQ